MNSIPTVLSDLDPARDVLTHLAAAFLIIALMSYSALHVVRAGKRSPLYPPGPPMLPIIGNAHIFPRKHIAKAFSNWARQYGDVFSVRIMNHNVIVLNTPSAVKEAFLKNGPSNSSRPASTIVDLIAPHRLNFGIVRQINEPWKAMRKASKLLLSAKNFRPFHGVLHAEATQLVVDLLLQPDAFMDHCERFTTSFMLAILYGARGPQVTSPDVRDFLNTNRRFMDALDILAAPPVDIFPVLKLVPRYFAGWRRNAESIGEEQDSLYGQMLQMVKARLSRGQGNDCLMEQAIRNAEDWNLENDAWLSHFGGTLLEGSFTTAGSLQTLILTAMAHPEAQALVAEELERVVGSDRVPSVEDFEQLPYTFAFIKESERLYPVAPIGLPHEMTQDTMINGYQYPKDAILFMNTWHIYRDERYFDRPDDFMPERFLNNTYGTRPGCQDDPARSGNMLFGGGLRVCPGMTIAKATLDMAGPYMLWAFEVKPSLDPATGIELPPKFELRSGIAAPPLPAGCRIIPRSESRRDVIRREFSRVAAELKKFELEITDVDLQYNRDHRDKH